MNQTYEELIRSERVTRATREVLLKRASSKNEEASRIRDANPVGNTHLLLEAVVRRLVPQTGSESIDIATELHLRRASGSGDGWRYASMPSDITALFLGLRCLEQSAQRKHGIAFTSLDGAHQDELLTAVQKSNVSWSGLDAGRWFEDLLTDATEIYVSHPSTLSAMGFSGIAFLPHWEEFGLNTTQPWEPRAMSRITEEIK